MFKLKHPHVCKSRLPRAPPRVLKPLAPVSEFPGTDFGVFLFSADSVSDCGEVMFGKVGGELFGIGYWLRKSPAVGQFLFPRMDKFSDPPGPAVMTLISGSAFLGLSTALNAISLHGACTAIFVAVSAIATLPLASLRRLENIKWIGWIGLISMLVSILLVTIAVATGGRPSLAPQEGPYDLGIVYWGKPKFADAMNAVANILLAYAGTAAFLPIASEMRDPRDYPKAVLACQGFVTAFYLVIGIVVYMYAGQWVASPALGTAGVLVKRIAYGLSIPGLLAAAVIVSFVRLPPSAFRFPHSTLLRPTLCQSDVFTV